MMRRGQVRRKLFEKGPQYPFMMWIPSNKCPEPTIYQAALKASGKGMDFLVLHVDENWCVWGFKDLTDQMRFCEDLKGMLSGVDVDSPLR